MAASPPKPTAALCALALAAAAGQAMAQAPPPTLHQVDSLVAVGSTAPAREALSRWWRLHDRDAAGDTRAHGLYLRAVLAPSFDSAENDLLGVVLGYPESADAPGALLRLGQGLVAERQPHRARAYLTRLVRDYPHAQERPTAFLWLARASLADGDAGAACDAAANGLGLAGGGDLGALLHHEQASACNGDAAPASAAAEGHAPPGNAPPLTPADSRGGGSYTVQIGAFRDPASARSVARAATQKGFDARVVRVPGSSLVRVRVGRFRIRDDAAGVLHRLHDAGFATALVDDAAAESNPQ
jgi:SPOR domain